MGVHSQRADTRSVPLRPMTAEDISAVARLEQAAFSDPWPASGFRELLQAPHTVMAVAEAAGEVVGYSVVAVVADEAELANIAVDPAYQRHGVARRLVGAAMEAARRRGASTLYLEVREGNAAARALYAALGFEEVGRRPGYYRRPDEDALVLARSLEAP